LTAETRIIEKATGCPYLDNPCVDDSPGCLGKTAPGNDVDFQVWR
jgi:hypothetical protein